MTRRPLAHILILSAALLLGAGPYLVRAAGRHPDAGMVANVDLQRVLAESEARKSADAQVREYANLVARRYDETARLQYLTAEEIGQYSEAINAETPTDAQKQRAAALKAEAAKRLEEFQKLSTTKEGDLTAPMRARLRELTDIEQQRGPALEGLQRIYQNMVQDQQAKLMRDAQAEVRAVIGKLAKEQGFTEVYDTSSLVYAPIDLTPQALQRVKKK